MGVAALPHIYRCRPWFIGMVLSLFANLCQALPEYQIFLKDNLFSPAEIEIPAHKKVKITFINQDNTPEEIDSFDLNREKVVFGNSRSSIYVGPLPEGEYVFFGEYHPGSATGKVVVVNEEGE